jgi:vacuolar-type H+-ATPase subunit H
MRGADTQVVEEFRAASLREISLLLAENQALAAENQALAAEASAAPGLEVGDQAVRILVSAQRQREQLITEAQVYAQQVGDAGERQRRNLLDDARLKSEALVRTTLEDAARQAADIISRAPGDAQAKVLKMQAFGDVIEAHLEQMVAGISASLDAWRAGVARPTANGTAGSGSPLLPGPLTCAR